MKAQVTSYIFYRRADGYDYITKDKRLIFISDKMMECYRRQYTLQGFMTFADNENWLIFSRVDNKVEIFMEKLNKTISGRK